MASEKKKIFFGSSISCEGVKPPEGGRTGKTDCYNTFTAFRIWGYPAVRSWHIVFTMYGLRKKGKYPVDIFIRRAHGRKKRKVATVIFEIERTTGEDLGSVASAPLNYTFLAEGMYAIELELQRRKVSHKLYVRASTQPWPIFSGKEIETFRKSKTLARSFRANFSCSKCMHPYMFEESILPDYEYPPGVRPFPKSGKLKCENRACGKTIFLKDAQGQLRATIKSTIQREMKH